MATAHELDRRRHSSKRKADIDAHWEALPDEYIETAPIKTLAIFIEMLRAPNNIAWGTPNRGSRRNTKWERLNVAARNRHWRLLREEDRASMGLGHNSRANAPPNPNLPSQD
jgi:hypothetical protein